MFYFRDKKLTGTSRTLRLLLKNKSIWLRLWGLNTFPEERAPNDKTPVTATFPTWGYFITQNLWNSKGDPSLFKVFYSYH